MKKIGLLHEYQRFQSCAASAELALTLVRSTVFDAGAGLRLLTVWLLSSLLFVPPSWAEESGAAGGYRIEPGDVIEVSVWREPDLDREVLIRPDGGISLPLAGELIAQGKTVAELSEAIAAKLEEFLPDPVVTVTVRQLTGSRIYVLGRVQRPGEFPLLRPINVMQALSMAGGLTPYADRKDIMVLRGSGDQQRALPFNYKEIERGQALEQNIELQPGDVVVVP